MAAVDALTIDGGARDYTRWAAGCAFALAIHAAAFVYLNRAPAPTGFESQVPIELDMMPPPPGEAKMTEPGAVDVAQAEATRQVQPDEAEQTPSEPEMLEEIDPDDAPPPPDSETIAAEEPAQQAETPPEEAVALSEPLDSVETPPDVEAAVTLPPERTVVAREEPGEQPKPAVKTAERTREATQAQRAGGAGGVSASAGAAASRAAASAFGSKVRAAVAARKPKSPTLSGRVTVSFTVTRSGAVTGVSASGGGAEAAAAAAMVRGASIPSMPAEMTGGSARYTLPINFTPGR